MTDQNLSYEQARAELGEVVQQLESGRVPLATAMELWERGEKLATICHISSPTSAPPPPHSNDDRRA